MLDDKIYLLHTFSHCFQLEIDILTNPEGNKANLSGIFDVNNPKFTTVFYIPAASRFFCHSGGRISTREQAAFAWSVYYQTKLGRIFNGFIAFLQMNTAGAKARCNLCNNVWQSSSLTSPFPVSRPFIDLALKFRKKSLNPEHCSSIDPCTKTVLPLLQPSTSTWLCNAQISMEWYNHLSKCVFPTHQINQHLLNAAHGCSS